MKLSVTLFGYDFTPSLWSTILVLIFLPFLFSLGVWQLQRADFKRNLLNQYAARVSQPSITLSELNKKSKSEWAFAHVRLQGTFIDKPLLLDNQFKRHRLGFHVLLPMKTSEGIVLVSRGWVKAGPSRRRLPKVTIPNGDQTVSGIIRLYDKPAFRLSDVPDARTSWPKIIQGFDRNILNKLLKLDLWPTSYHGVVIVAPDGEPVVNMKPARHTAYAIQWFTMAIALFLLYLIVNIRKTEPRDMA